jgi:heat-inducible transcriptional repressor
MFVLSVRGGLVKTVVLGFEADLQRSEIDRIVSILNERLAGLTLREIRDSHQQRVRDVEDRTGLVDLVSDEATLIFSEPKEGRLRIGGTQNILTQPEFQQPDEVRQFIEVIEDEDRVIEILEELFESDLDAVGQASVRIGSQMHREDMDAYSIVTSPYRLGDTIGRLGVIGPTRMDYARAVALVENMADVVNQPAADGAVEKDDATGADADS